VSRMALIKALNNALYFSATPVVSFVTFATARALGRTLSVPTVFFCLSLLRLPQLYMVTFFILGAPPRCCPPCAACTAFCAVLHVCCRIVCFGCRCAVLC
jgi:hypothetical protein